MVAGMQLTIELSWQTDPNSKVISFATKCCTRCSNPLVTPAPLLQFAAVALLSAQKNVLLAEDQRLPLI